MKRCVLSLERNIGREDEFRVSGGSEFQRRGPMTSYKSRELIGDEMRQAEQVHESHFGAVASPSSPKKVGVRTMFLC